MASGARFISLTWLQWECTKISVSSERMEEEMLSNLPSSSAELKTKKDCAVWQCVHGQLQKGKGNLTSCGAWLCIQIALQRASRVAALGESGRWLGLRGRWRMWTESCRAEMVLVILDMVALSMAPWNQTRWPRTNTEWGGNSLSGSHGQLDWRCWGKGLSS